MRFALLFLLSAGLATAEEPLTLARMSSLPAATDPNFQFRKVKIYALEPEGPHTKGAAKNKNPDELNQKTNLKSKSVTQEASINFERSYRMFGAVTALDQHQRFGQYFDFFWRAKRPADLTVRFEYKQEKLRAFVQAKEIGYRDVHGTNKTEFRVTGDEYFDDGRVLAWRCLLVEHGRIVAEKRSFLWD